MRGKSRRTDEKILVLPGDKLFTMEKDYVNIIKYNANQTTAYDRRRA
jgi:hypothetical protein